MNRLVQDCLDFALIIAALLAYYPLLIGESSSGERFLLFCCAAVLVYIDNKNISREMKRLDEQISSRLKNDLKKVWEGR